MRDIGFNVFRGFPIKSARNLCDGVFAARNRLFDHVLRDLLESLSRRDFILGVFVLRKGAP